jgi:hypothetical protein
LCAMNFITKQMPLHLVSLGLNNFLFK